MGAIHPRVGPGGLSNIPHVPQGCALSLQKIRNYVTRAEVSQSARLLRGAGEVPSGT
jgi:hypothetical protein